MPRPTTQLTDTAITKAKPRDKKYKLYDGGGLFLLIMPIGSKLWRVKYRFNGKEKEYAIGAYPPFTLSKARTIRDELKRLIADGIDPNEKKKQEKRKDTEEEKLTAFEIKTQLHLVINEWLELHEKKVTAYTAKKTRALLYEKLLPTFSKYTDRQHIKTSTPISHIKHFEITELLKATAKETEYTAKRLKQFLNRIWLFAVTSGYCEANIISNISNEVLPAPKTKNMAKITDEKILGRLLNDLDNYQGNIIVRASLQFLTLTMLRATTLVTLKWEYIDFDNKVLIIPRETMKVKDTNLNDFILPLVPKAIAILKELQEITGADEYVFSIAGKPINKESGNKALRLMGYSDESKGLKQTQHSFRGTFRSLADTHQEKHKASFEAKEAVLDHHVGGKVERAYTHKSDYLEQMRGLLEWYADYLEGVKCEK
jgi:integrase